MTMGRGYPMCVHAHISWLVMQNKAPQKSQWCTIVSIPGDWLDNSTDPGCTRRRSRIWLACSSPGRAGGTGATWPALQVSLARACVHGNGRDSKETKPSCANTSQSFVCIVFAKSLGAKAISWLRAMLE